MSHEIDLIDIVERLTRLEAENASLEASQLIMMSKLDTLLERFIRYEAKWGGIFMVLSALLGLFLAFKTEILGVFRGR
jgi:hypothetical protein